MFGKMEGFKTSSLGWQIYQLQMFAIKNVCIVLQTIL